MINKEHYVKDRSYAFVPDIIRLYKYLISEKKEFIISNQMLRSGTAIEALIREARHGPSKVDF